MTTTISPFVIGARYIAPFFAILIGYYFLTMARKMRSVNFATIVLFAMCYPIGKTFQLWLVGPRWIRWYMSDVGFISMVMIWIGFSGIAFFGKTVLERIKIGAWDGFILAVIVETLQLCAKSQSVIHKKGTFAASGDWVDMAIFFVMYIVNISLLARLKRECGPPKPPGPVTYKHENKKNRKR
ncbi:MAG: hypothetical protein V4473_00870 [Patescibacteria group bacterium]